jgi:N-acetylneuraminic acid mutarotase
MIKKIGVLFGVILFTSTGFGINIWNQKASCPGVARHRTTTFTIGNKGYIGLGHINSGPSGNVYQEDFWEYDPANNSWTQKADFGGGLRYHAVGVGYGSKAYVGTGRDQTGAGPAYILETDWWEFDPIANTWTLKAPFPGQGRRGAVAFLIDDKIFVGTGQVNSGYTADFFAYDITNDVWLSGVPDFPGGARTSAVAFSIIDKGYVGTGGIGCGTTDFYEYKLATNTWTQRANVGTIIRNESCGFAVNGKGYIGTGDDCSSGNNYKDFWEYNPTTDTWVEMAEFPGAARRYMNSFVIGNKVYCGSGTSGVNYADLWEFDQVLATLEMDKDLVSISNYPNPAFESTNFVVDNLPNGLNYSDLTLTLFDMQGRLVHEETFQESIMYFSRGRLKSGVYVYSVWYEGNEIKQSKLIFE